MARAKRQGGGFSLLSLDLDGLKAVNDSRGHAAGDCLLRETARVLQSVLRAQDRAYRVGGDEFVAILPGRPEPAAPFCARVVRQTREQLRDIGFDAGLCAGVAHFPDEAQALEALLELSDRRMYARRGTRAARAADGQRRPCIGAPCVGAWLWPP